MTIDRRTCLAVCHQLAPRGHTRVTMPRVREPDAGDERGRGIGRSHAPSLEEARQRLKSDDACSRWTLHGKRPHRLVDAANERGQSSPVVSSPGSSGSMPARRSSAAAAAWRAALQRAAAEARARWASSASTMESAPLRRPGNEATVRSRSGKRELMPHVAGPAKAQAGIGREPQLTIHPPIGECHRHSERCRAGTRGLDGRDEVGVAGDNEDDAVALPSRRSQEA